MKFNKETNFKQTEIGEIPEDWGVVKLGDKCKVSSGGSAPQGKKYFKGGKYPFIRVQHLENELSPINKYDLITEDAIKEYSLKLFPKNTIVFPKSGASVFLEKRAILPFDAYIVSHLCAVNSESENLNQMFLFFLLSQTKLANKKADNYPTLNLTEIKSLPIPLPPLPEQKAIAEVLKTSQENIEKTEKVISSLKELKKSLMKHLFTYGPVPKDELYKVKTKQTEIGEIPEHWDVVKLGDIFDVQQGKSLSPKARVGSRIRPFLRTSNILWSKVDISKLDYMHFEEKEEEKLKLEIGDLLVCEGGDIGRCAIWEKQLSPCYYQNHIHRLRTKNRNIESWFYMYWMEKAWRLSQIYKGSGNDTTIPNLSQSRLKSLPISLPPLPEQQKIAEILRSLDERIEKEENYKKALQNMFKSLLNNLMSGKIRVEL